jgi:GWxTD domain-containing protein
MTDVNNGRTGTAVKEIQVNGTEHFSDVEMARTLMPVVEGSTSPLRKGGLIVYPAASARFTVPGEQMFYTYQEIYGLGGTNLLRHSQLLNAESVPVFGRPAEVITIPTGMETVALVDSFDLSVARESGLYSLTVTYTADGDTLHTFTKPMFIEVAESAAASGQTIADANRKLQVLPLLLNSEESALYERLDQEGKARYYDNFWNARPGELSNFLGRYNIVMARYGSLGREGWQSDRGRVYLIYGEPDEVESNPFSTTQAPYTAWYYYGNEQEMFVFADLMGNGDYLQIYSTVEGEVSYSNWQGMIQNVNRGTGSYDDEGF